MSSPRIPVRMQEAQQQIPDVLNSGIFNNYKRFLQLSLFGLTNSLISVWFLLLNELWFLHSAPELLIKHQSQTRPNHSLTCRTNH